MSYMAEDILQEGTGESLKVDSNGFYRVTIASEPKILGRGEHGSDHLTYVQKKLKKVSFPDGIRCKNVLEQYMGIDFWSQSIGSYLNLVTKDDGLRVKSFQNSDAYTFPATTHMPVLLPPPLNASHKITKFGNPQDSKRLPISVMKKLIPAHLRVIQMSGEPTPQIVTTSRQNDSKSLPIDSKVPNKKAGQNPKSRKVKPIGDRPANQKRQNNGKRTGTLGK